MLTPATRSRLRLLRALLLTAAIVRHPVTVTAAIVLLLALVLVLVLVALRAEAVNNARVTVKAALVVVLVELALLLALVHIDILRAAHTVLLLIETSVVLLLLAAVVNEAGILLLLLLLTAAVLAGFVTVRIEELFNFGVFFLVRFFLQTDFDHERNSVRLFGVRYVQHANRMTERGKLFVGNFNGLLRSAVQVETDNADRAFEFTFDNFGVINNHTGIATFRRFNFRLDGDNLVFTDWEPARAALGWIKIACVKRLKKLHD